LSSDSSSKSYELFSDNARNISGTGLDRTVAGSNVTYSYALKTYHNSEELSTADTVMRSSASCIGRSVVGEKVYEKGKQIGTIRRKYKPLVPSLSSTPF
jgi:SMC interacting uncharacterized protein involved in chromosome segregation